MLKNILFTLILICATILGASTKGDTATNVKGVFEHFKDATAKELSEHEAEFFDRLSASLSTSVDDLLLYARLSARTFLALGLFGNRKTDSFAQQFVGNEKIFAKMEEELAEFNETKDVTIEKLLKNHADLVNELIKETSATEDEIVFLTRLLIAEKENNNFDYADKQLVHKVQRESTMCPVPPEEHNKDPSSAEIQKYIRQMFSLDPNAQMSYASKVVNMVKGRCSIPLPILEKIQSMQLIWFLLNFTN